MSGSKASKILVYGGAGALGRSVLQRFHGSGWITYSADVAPLSESYVRHSFQIHPSQPPSKVVDSVSKFLEANPGPSSASSSAQFDCIVCTAGGFLMDTIAADNFYEQLETIWKWNTMSAFQCSSIAAKFLNNSSATATTSTANDAPFSLFVLTGAAAALNPTPVMLSYGISKIAVHQLIRSLAADGSGMPAHSKTIGIVPVTIDTPANREAMSGANFDNWTKCDDFAEQIFEWATSDGSQITNGGLYQFNTENNKTTVSGGGPGGFTCNI